jgi:potassium-transporting ATPase KdpC subunit
MKSELMIAVRVTLVTLILTGLVYPLIMTGLAQLIAPHAANGSLVTDDKGTVIGSELIGQNFAGAAYFQPRPSAAGDKGYDAAGSSGSNLGPTSQKLYDRVKGDVDRLRKENPDAAAPVPDELVTTSASGLDPHLSPATALWQVPRIAKARGVKADRVEQLTKGLIEGRTFGVLGEPRVNVLSLNLELDKVFGRPTVGK